MCSSRANESKQFLFVEILGVDEQRDRRHHGSSLFIDEVDIDVLRSAFEMGVREIVVDSFLFAHSG